MHSPLIGVIPSHGLFVCYFFLFCVRMSSLLVYSCKWFGLDKFFQEVFMKQYWLPLMSNKINIQNLYELISYLKKDDPQLTNGLKVREF